MKKNEGRKVKEKRNRRTKGKFTTLQNDEPGD